MKVNVSKTIRIIITALMLAQMPFIIAGNSSTTPASATSTAKKADNLSLNKATEMYDCMQLQDEGLSKDAFEKAWIGYKNLLEKHTLSRNDIITIADFSKPSTEKRLFVIDLVQQKLLHKSLVAHGRNSGQLYATSFSNKPETNKSSLGFYITLNSYSGENGYSLRLKGLEKNINDKAYERAIVMHGAPYVSEKKGRQNGFIGRSLGCPAIPEANARPIIQTIKNGSLLFIYHPGKQYVRQSTILKNQA